MVRIPSSLALLALAVAAALSACSVPTRPVRPAWRTQAEQACVAQRRVQPNEWIALANELQGPGICGMTKPYKVAALQGGRVTFNATATLDCSMVAELDQWLTDTVQPAAQARFGMNVVQINSMGSYACRGMNNQRGSQLSEHSFGNALDIGGFVLENGRQLTLVRDWWHGDEQARAFLMDVHRGSCGHFSTVLSPGSNAFHYNHIHVDLAQHGRSGRHICKPVPQETLPPPDQSPLISQQNVPAGEDTDNDTTGKPPLAAFEGPGVGANDSLGPVATPDDPLAYRRNDEATSSIGRRTR